MKNSILLSLLLCSTSLYAQDMALVDQAKNAVVDNLKARDATNKCTEFMRLAADDESKKPFALATCDNTFAVANGLTFSDVTVVESEGGKAVCGVVSGKTHLSKIGARFVYTEKNKSVTIKPSKQPVMTSSAAGDLGRNQVKMENKQYELVYTAYCQSPTS
ncbi:MULTISPECIES: hypothetical protein [Klebsiella]|uniref:hypothetical protein n=1 Tax=Klebsiella TaxID=570 RepID=UPI002247A544|nr:hypothetical protein [Klebsiella oxytoca]MCW9542002.1 hypothetical protein [Klebsiella oxytoca]MCW9563622.1 hypothetical protein [Klebsiella oxytoca]MCW9574163.1 hypothetical protein [Klebsiella oxytoca]WBQ40106.1 hypothetical protein NDX50_14680 [Klebsiella oxytoca]WKM71999.1 hypothetical protein Q2T70_27235 [Klebsiella oxytoca]